MEQYFYNNLFSLKCQLNYLSKQCLQNNFAQFIN